MEEDGRQGASAFVCASGLVMSHMLGSARMLRTAGLAATYAFIAAKSGDSDRLARAYRKAGQGICDRLSRLGLLPADARQLDARAILTELGGMDAVKYARASAEAATLTDWLSRLADAVVCDQKEKQA